ncbi:MAG: HEAT repeat domain-containing protein [Planctomycetota bacterium]|nr:HEAT repeat domain-containing protein [Planctomycetota bacterium]
MKRLLLCLLPLCACGGGTETAGTDTVEPFALSPVVAERLAQLEAEVPTPDTAQPLDQDRLEDLSGLLEVVAEGDPGFTEIALTEVREAFGPGAIPHLAAALRDPNRDWQKRSAAASLLAGLDHRQATEHLLAALEGAPEAWLRQHAAFHLSTTSADWVVPRLIKRLKYENDHETFIWLAVTLAHFHNYAGLDALFDLAVRGQTDSVRTQAQAQLDSLAQAVSLSPEELRRRWNSADARQLPQPTPSPALHLELWRLVQAMNDDTIQLRGVDDARYVLSRLGPWAAAEVSRALADDDFHVRLHSAQVLERMGARAYASGPMLLRALGEPLLAPNVAEALGRVGFPGARPALEERAGVDQPHELRVACVRALGRLGIPDSLTVVEDAFADGNPSDLRMAAATSLVLFDRGDAAAAWLTAEMTGTHDAPSAELALETWLVRGVDRGRTGFDGALTAWRAELAAPPGVTPSLALLAERRAKRAADLTARLTALRGES